MGAGAGGGADVGVDADVDADVGADDDPGLFDGADDVAADGADDTGVFNVAADSSLFDVADDAAADDAAADDVAADGTLPSVPFFLVFEHLILVSLFCLLNDVVPNIDNILDSPKFSSIL